MYDETYYNDQDNELEDVDDEEWIEVGSTTSTAPVNNTHQAADLAAQVANNDNYYAILGDSDDEDGDVGEDVNDATLQVFHSSFADVTVAYGNIILQYTAGQFRIQYSSR